MKTWIIVLTIVFAVLKIAEMLVRNYITNDNMERVKYYFSQGASTLGCVHGLLYLLSVLVGAADIILVIILLIDKL